MNPQRLIESFYSLISIESPSWHERDMAQRCERELASMGFAVTFDDSASETGSDTGNLIALLPGTVEGRIMFSSHMDTVKPCSGIEPVIMRRIVDGEEVEVICSAGQTILSADDKAGIAAIFEGVQSVVEANAPRPDIVVLLTTCEEQSLLGSSALKSDVFSADAFPVLSSSKKRTDVSRETFSTGRKRTESEPAPTPAPTLMPEPASILAPASSSASIPAPAPAPVPCFVLDADGRPGSIVVGAPFHYTMRATFTGRAAHAGVEPEAGASAIQMAAHAISHMPLGRIDERTTANVGVVDGGTAVNVVAAQCRIEGECRSLYEDRVEAQRRAMTEACQSAAASFGGKVDVEWVLDYPGILFDADAPIVRRLSRAIEAAGLEVRKTISGGGADANVLSAKGVEAITLGVGMTNFHSTDEYIAVRDLEDAARLVEAIIAEYAQAEQSE